MLSDIYKDESGESKLKLGLAVLIPSVVDATIVTVLQAGAQAGSEAGPELFLFFCALCVIRLFVLRHSIRTCAATTEKVLCEIRVRIADKLRRVEIQGLEKIGSAEIFNLVTQATTTISDSIWTLVDTLQSIVMIAGISIYFFSLSPPGFILALIFFGGGGLVFYQRRRQVKALMRKARATQVDLFKFLTALLAGGKEVRLRSQRGAELLVDLEQMARGLRAGPLQITSIFLQNFITARLLLFSLLATLVFILPRLVPLDAGLLSALVASAVFLFGPLANVLRSLPEYERAELAAAGLQSLEERLELAATDSVNVPDDSPSPFSGGFSVIEANQLGFAYSDPAGGPSFSLGPVSFSLRAGEIVFFVGGNGSGKTTLLKLLCGLYSPTSGSLRINGLAIEASNLQAYRELFSAIFTDFHLFKRLYGIPQDSADKVQDLLVQMQIAGKTSYGPAGFSSLDLSTGQRKRIAMVVALLEDRPIYIFDEWAADQDPEFRSYYYLELLPHLKRQGKTILAISHDDRFFHCADRVVFMEYGSIRSIDTYPQPQ